MEDMDVDWGVDWCVDWRIDWCVDWRIDGNVLNVLNHITYNRVGRRGKERRGEGAGGNG